MNRREKRVVILADAQTHMMPALARKMARREHDLVLGDAVGLLGKGTHELDATGRNDERLESLGSQMVEQLLPRTG